MLRLELEQPFPLSHYVVQTSRKAILDSKKKAADPISFAEAYKKDIGNRWDSF